MNETDFRKLLTAVLGEVEGTLAGVNPGDVLALAEAILRASRVFAAGEGRSGFVAKCLAMRLAHLGLAAHFAGETTAPAAGPGDLLVAVSGSGATPVTAARAQVARQLGVRVAAVTSAGADSLVELADLVVALPVVPSQQYGGTRFEQAALLLLDALALLLQRRLAQTAADMDARHATLE